MLEASGVPPRARPLLASIVGLAALQILLGLLALGLAAAGVVHWESETVVRDWQRATQIVAFSGFASYVLSVGRADARAVYLGVLFLLVAVFYANPALSAFAGPSEEGLTWIAGLQALPVDAFTPAVAWLFARDFPRSLEWRRSGAFVRAAIAISIAAALGLIAANLAYQLAPSGSASALALFDRGDPWSHYWTVVFGLLLPSLPFILWRSLHAPREEKRRVRLLATGLAVFSVSPVVFSTLAPTIPHIARSDWAEGILVPLNQLMLLGLAATAAYSVLVDDVLDVRIVLRAAAQYALARAVAWTPALLPLGWFAWILYDARDQPLMSLLRGSRPATLAALLLAGGAALLARRRIMAAVDQIFFREPYDPQVLLSAVASHARAAVSTASLLAGVAEELNEALHLESVAVLARASGGESLLPATGAIRPLPGDSLLMEVLASSPGPVEVDGDRLRPQTVALPERDRLWLVDSGAALLVPMPGVGGVPMGLLALGRKRSQLPFSRQDRLALESLASTVGSAIENRLLRESGSIRAPGRTGEGPAKECCSCGHVVGADHDACVDCGGEVRIAALPQCLLGKFQVERRIGEGATGVVYRARDLTLGREVALKTLTTTAPEQSARLRREARAMAAVVHPNLAAIYGAEMWLGTFVLVIEYLAGGTLEEHRDAWPLDASEAFGLAGTVADALRSTHAQGLLHRDVKPSNIGFAADGKAKLLDFGLANMVGLAVAEGGAALAGTPLYMPPEALRGNRPEPGFDLWSLSVVTCEIVCGKHPFARSSWASSLRSIGQGWTQSHEALLPDAAKPAAPFFARCLARERGRRPATAADLAGEVAAAAQALEAASSLRP